jgi:hypothetical protein
MERGRKYKTDERLNKTKTQINKDYYFKNYVNRRMYKIRFEYVEEDVFFDKDFDPKKVNWKHGEDL